MHFANAFTLSMSHRYHQTYIQNPHKHSMIVINFFYVKRDWEGDKSCWIQLFWINPSSLQWPMVGPEVIRGRYPTPTDSALYGTSPTYSYNRLFHWCLHEGGRFLKRAAPQDVILPLGIDCHHSNFSSFYVNRLKWSPILLIIQVICILRLTVVPLTPSLTFLSPLLARLARYEAPQACFIKVTSLSAVNYYRPCLQI